MNVKEKYLKGVKSLYDLDDVDDEILDKRLEGRLAVVLFRDDDVIIMRFIDRELKKCYRVKKEKFDFVIGSYVLENSDNILSFCEKTSEDLRIMRLIADILGMDFDDVECTVNNKVVKGNDYAKILKRTWN